jgi:coenzyme F420-dependent glucose-6-phosphate dehydrogenase
VSTAVDLIEIADAAGLGVGIGVRIAAGRRAALLARVRVRLERRRLDVQQVVGDLVERGVLAFGQRLQSVEELRLGSLADSVLEQLGLPGRQTHTRQKRLQLGSSRGIHGRLVPAPVPEKRGLVRLRPVYDNRAVPELGFALSSEDFPPNELVQQAALAERSGFAFCTISDHYHPWIDKQGHASFVWSTLGAIAHATTTIRVWTGVTCPMIRIHPAIVAQAAATVATMMPGRFALGVGSGENLNEHVLGDRWPLPDERLEMLGQGGEQTHRGKHYTVDHARVYDLPGEPVEVYVAASQSNAAELAGRIGDGFISTAPDEKIVDAFEAAGGKGKPKLGMIHVAYDEDAQAGLKRAHELWPNTALKGPLGQELATPSDFEAAAEMIEPGDLAETTPHGPDPGPYLELIGRYEDAGFTHVFIHQIGSNQDEFAKFAARELLPKT